MRALIVTLALVGCGAPQTTAPQPGGVTCKPADPCWPSPADWQALRGKLTGKLVQPHAPAASSNPFALQDDPGATESRGWLDAWTSVPSAYAIAAETPADVAAGVAFAAAHHLRLVIRGTGHDYLGRSTAPDSLMIWTHAMRQITIHDSFVPAGCAVAGVPAVSVGAGTRWGEAYRAVSVEHGRYVQGGGCTSVGVAGGFLQGGGFGTWSRQYGVAAGNLLEAEVVTADGKIRIANACQNPDLFWALRGGGGGTFGVVTRATLMTFPLPSTFGVATGAITASTPEAYRAMIGHFVVFARDHLIDAHWGEGPVLRGQKLSLTMLSEGLSQPEAEAVWKPFRDWVATQPALTGDIKVLAMPATMMWNAPELAKATPELIQRDDRPGASPGAYWWTPNNEEVNAYWYAYQSRWLPRALFDDPDRLADALVAAASNWTVNISFNKSLAGAAPDAIARSRATAINPAVFDAGALVIIAALAEPGQAADSTEGATQRARVAAAMAPIHAIAPAAAYVNEADYFEPDWQQSFWGSNYARLLAIKHRYDPTGLFSCHHCVGGE